MLWCKFYFINIHLIYLKGYSKLLFISNVYLNKFQRKKYAMEKGKSCRTLNRIFLAND